MNFKILQKNQNLVEFEQRSHRTIFDLGLLHMLGGENPLDIQTGLPLSLQGHSGTERGTEQCPSGSIVSHYGLSYEEETDNFMFHLTYP